MPIYRYVYYVYNARGTVRIKGEDSQPFRKTCGHFHIHMFHSHISCEICCFLDNKSDLRISWMWHTVIATLWVLSHAGVGAAPGEIFSRGFSRITLALNCGNGSGWDPGGRGCGDSSLQTPRCTQERGLRDPFIWNISDSELPQQLLPCRGKTS